MKLLNCDTNMCTQPTGSNRSYIKGREYFFLRLRMWLSVLFKTILKNHTVTTEATLHINCTLNLNVYEFLCVLNCIFYLVLNLNYSEHLPAKHLPAQ